MFLRHSIKGNKGLWICPFHLSPALPQPRTDVNRPLCASIRIPYQCSWIPTLGYEQWASPLHPAHWCQVPHPVVCHYQHDGYQRNFVHLHSCHTACGTSNLGTIHAQCAYLSSDNHPLRRLSLLHITVRMKYLYIERYESR